MKIHFLKKFALTLGSVAMIATSVALAPAAQADGLNRPAFATPVSLYNSGGNEYNNSTGEFSLPGDDTSINLNYSATVPFGGVAAGDVLKLKLSVTNKANNSLIEFRKQTWGGDDFWVPVNPNTRNNLSSVVTESVYTHTVTAADVSSGVFLNFNTSSNRINNVPTTNYQNFNIWFTNADPINVKVNAVWTKGTTVVAPTSQYFSVFSNYQIMNADQGWDMSDNALTYFEGSGTYGSSINSYGCVDMSTLSVGDVISLTGTYTINGAGVLPLTTGLNSYNNKISASVNWDMAFGVGVGNQGTMNVDYGNSSVSNLANSSTATINLQAATQKMLDGAVSPSGAKTKLLGINFNFTNLDLVGGRHVFTLKASTANHPGNLLVSCKATDVVNLTAKKTANGVDVSFAEAGTGTYDVAGWHYCMLRLKKTKNNINAARDWLGGVSATEVTPATSPKSFTCSIQGMTQNVGYEVAIYNGLMPRGSYADLQTTWLNIVSTPDVSTDATATSIGIGTSTNDIIFDPATTTYNVTSTDITTAYPSVVTGNSTSTYVVKLNGTTVAKPNNLALKTGANVVTVEVTSPSGAKKTYTFNVTKVNTAADATLKSLSFGSETLTPEFSSSTVAYSTSVSSTTTTYPFPTATATQSGSTVVVKQGGSVVTGPGALNLVDGANVVTVEVTAPDGTTKKTYTMTITKASAAKDATLSGLPTITGVTTAPAFDAEVTSYTSTVSESTTSVEATGAASTNVNGATTVYKLNGVVVTLPGTLNLRPGANKLETIVTSSDGTTTKTYTETITRTVLTAGGSTGANDARLAVNPVPGASYVAADGQTVTGFDPEVTGTYTKNVPVNQTSVDLASTVAAVADATVVNEYSVDGGITWLPATSPLPLAAGKTTKVRTTVTKGTDTKVYTTDIVRPAEDLTSDVGPTEGDGDLPAKSIPNTGKFVATNDPTFLVSWSKATGKLVSQATGIYTGYIEGKITFTKAGKAYSCVAVFGTITKMPGTTAAQKKAAEAKKTFTGKQFCIDKLKMNPATTAPAGGFTKTNILKIKSMNKTAAELAQEKLALAALKNFTGTVDIQITRYRVWPTTMLNIVGHTAKGAKIPVQVRGTEITLN